MSAGRARVFFALWPDERVREALAAVARAAQARSGGRLIAPEKIHLTLFFVGNVERARMPALEGIAAATRGTAFDLTFDTIRYWRRNGIVWAGSRECPHALAALERALRTDLACEGVHGEDREYVPHVTLLRDAERAPGIALEPCVWRASEFMLIESKAVGGGVTYEPLARWPLSHL